MKNFIQSVRQLKDIVSDLKVLVEIEKTKNHDFRINCNERHQRVSEQMSELKDRLKNLED